MVQNRISFGGLASGLDTNAIIDALMEVQRRPIFTQEVRCEDTLQKKQALQAVGSSFSTLLGSMGALKLASTFTSQCTSVLAQGDDANRILATADGNAALGSFDVEVSQIATATTARSATPVGQAINSAVPLDQAGFIDGFAAGTFTINSTEFTIPAATNTTIDSASAIGAGVDRVAGKHRQVRVLADLDAAEPVAEASGRNGEDAAQYQKERAEPGRKEWGSFEVRFNVDREEREQGRRQETDGERDDDEGEERAPKERVSGHERNDEYRMANDE